MTTAGAYSGAPVQDPNGSPAPTGTPALDATTLANLGLSAAEAQGQVMVGTTAPAIDPSSQYDVLAGAGYSQVRQNTSVGGALQQWYSMDAKDVEELQHKLWDAGLYPSSWYKNGTEPSWGDPFSDSQGFSAYRTLLRRASTSNKPIDDILSATAGQGAQRAAAGEQGTIDELKQIIKTNAPKVLGQNISDGDVAALIGNYEAAKTAGSVPSASDFVDQQLAALHPDQAASQTFQTEASAMLDTANRPTRI